MKILFGDFNVKLGREDICKPTTCSDSLHQNNKIMVFEGQALPHPNLGGNTMRQCISSV